MLVLAALFVLALPACLQGVRSSVSELDTGLPELRVHAVTFNAGNRVFDENDHVFNGLINEILPGHESVNQEADIVLLGFQEFEDNKYAMGNEIRAKKLWTMLGARKVRDLQLKAREMFSRPEHVRDIIGGIQESNQNIRNSIEARFTQLQHVYDEATEELFGVSTERPNAQTQVQLLMTAVNGLKKVVEDYRILPIQDWLLPVRTWGLNVVDHLLEFRTGFPNLKLSNFAETSWNLFVTRFRDIVKKDYEYVRRFSKAEFDAEIIQLTQRIDHIDERTQSSHWDLVKRIIAVLGDQVKKYIGDRKAESELLEKAGKTFYEQEVILEKNLEQWPANAEVRMEPQKFNSGPACQALTHFDTVLYAYVNPWSKLKVRPDEYSNDQEGCEKRNEHSQKNLGCNINNNQDKECGKVVNFLVFQIEHNGAIHRLCALNTHMSYAGSAEHRINLIKNASLETQRAGCQSVVFMGDFNTRMHCGTSVEFSSPPDVQIPPFARSTGTASSFDYLLNNVCKDGTHESCSLKDSSPMTHTWDEMHQILNNDMVYCYEKRKSKGTTNWFTNKKKRYYKLQRINNPVKQMGFLEADIPPFPPTYKLKDPTKIKSVPREWHRCNPNKIWEACFINKDTKAKHNPAWTDRILVKANKFVTDEYARRMIDPKFGSDHAPVIANLRIDLNLR